MTHPPLQARLLSAIAKRTETRSNFVFRPREDSQVDFATNDYLGGHRPASAFQQFLEQSGLSREKLVTCSTGSRMMTGHTDRVSKVESMAARLHGAEAGLVLNSGYDGNLSLFGTLPAHQDAIVFDELVHASVHDGMRLGRARSNIYSFRHNDLESMSEEVIRAAKKHSGTVFVSVETVYSMDGDVTPIREMLEKCRLLSRELGRDVYLIADEAHSAGLFGENGSGFICMHNLQSHPNLLARLVTFGKAFSAHGAVVLGPQLVIKFLTNFARPLLFSTALPPKCIAAMTGAYLFARTAEAEQARRTLWERVAFFNRTAVRHLPADVLPKSNGQSAVQAILIPGARRCRLVSERLLEEGFNVFPVWPPVVPAGSERLRCVVHAHNTEEEIESFIELVAQERSRIEARL